MIGVLDRWVKITIDTFYLSLQKTPAHPLDAKYLQSNLLSRWIFYPPLPTENEPQNFKKAMLTISPTAASEKTLQVGKPMSQKDREQKQESMHSI